MKSKVCGGCRENNNEYKNNEIKSSGVDCVLGDPSCPYNPKQMYVRYEIHLPLALI